MKKTGNRGGILMDFSRFFMILNPSAFSAVSVIRNLNKIGIDRFGIRKGHYLRNRFWQGYKQNTMEIDKITSLAAFLRVEERIPSFSA